jgi:galactokinase
MVTARIIELVSTMVNADQLRSDFRKRFGRDEPALLVRAPGRVNLIGEHTDYNDGFVLPIATEQAVWVAAAPRSDRLVRAHSTAVDQTIEVSLEQHPPAASQKWSNYLRGVVAMLLSAGCRLEGADLLIDSDVPVGGGLSSSAALEVGLAKALLGISGEILETIELALLCRQAEHRYAGVPCGIMDQFACLLAQAGAALLLDCRSRHYEHVGVQRRGACFVVIDTQVKHALGKSEYPLRQEQCQTGVDYFQRLDGAVRALRDVSQDMLERHVSQLDPVVAARCHHVITENRRVTEAVDAFKRGHLDVVGKLLLASHESLRDKYEVSCRELDAVVDIVAAVEGVYGARMTGGGFGGCAVVLAEEGAVEPLYEAIRTRYDPARQVPARLFRTKAAAGAEVIMS